MKYNYMLSLILVLCGYVAMALPVKKTIVLVGPTGASKTSLAALFEQIMKGNENEFIEFKSKIVEFPRASAQSQTAAAKIYEIKNSDLELRIIDTPGFNDTNTQKTNNDVIKEIRPVIASHDIDGIFVVLNSMLENRATPRFMEFCRSLKQLFPENTRKHMRIIAGRSDAGMSDRGNMLVANKLEIPHSRQYPFTNSPFILGRAGKVTCQEEQEEMERRHDLNIKVFGELIESLPEEPISGDFFSNYARSIEEIKGSLQKLKEGTEEWILNSKVIDIILGQLQKVWNILTLLGPSPQVGKDQTTVALVNKKTGKTCYEGFEREDLFFKKEAKWAGAMGLGSGAFGSASVGKAASIGVEMASRKDAKKTLDENVAGVEKDLTDYLRQQDARINLLEGQLRSLKGDPASSGGFLRVDSSLEGAIQARQTYVQNANQKISDLKSSFAQANKSMNKEITQTSAAAASSLFLLGTAILDKHLNEGFFCRECKSKFDDHEYKRTIQVSAPINLEKDAKREANRAKLAVLDSKKSELLDRQANIEAAKELALHQLKEQRRAIEQIAPGSLTYLLEGLRWNDQLSKHDLDEFDALIRDVLK